MNDALIDPKRRIKELRAIPERDRTDEQWDELNELEIQLAPGNRLNAPMTPMLNKNPAPPRNNNNPKKMFHNKKRSGPPQQQQQKPPKKPNPAV
ncbi:MAG: hypothetical protein M0P39_04920 [Rhodocyclaceae bacterium]|jgi:hypothetical protein|nr:hypothetical protein [Rhodocyclaceae bacterium]